MYRTLVVALILAGCSAGTPPPRGDGDGGGGGGTDGAPMTWDAGPGWDAGFMGCVGTPYEAEQAFQPVDIVWVIDTSGSMSDEAERVQMNMVAFADAIGAVGIDWHVVMISTQDFVNVPASLADDPRYLLVNRPVSSSEPMVALISEYSTYESHLRRRAALHFVAVTDDESSLAWESFRDMMRSLLGKNFVFHTISSEVAGPPSLMNPDGQPCQTSSGFPPEGAAAPGEQYWAMAAATGGRTFSICTPADAWSELFTNLTAAIAIPVVIPCEYAIPPAPSGTDLDLMRVNVRYTPGGGAPMFFPYVGTSDGADCTSGGWYYDDITNPTRIILCPNTCTPISTDTEGRVDVELGCQTFII